MEPEQAKKLSKIPFIVVLVCLLLPWIKISCAPPGSPMEMELGTINGLKLITGGEFTPAQKSPMMGGMKVRTTSTAKKAYAGGPNLLAILVVLMALGGIAMATQNAKAAMILAIIGLVGVLLLPFDPFGQLMPKTSKIPTMPPSQNKHLRNPKMTANLSKQMEKSMEQLMQAIKISNTWGAYLVILSFLAAIFLNFTVMQDEQKPKLARYGGDSPPYGGGNPPSPGGH